MTIQKNLILIYSNYTTKLETKIYSITISSQLSPHFYFMIWFLDATNINVSCQDISAFFWNRWKFKIHFQFLITMINIWVIVCFHVSACCLFRFRVSFRRRDWFYGRTRKLQNKQVEKKIFNLFYSFHEPDISTTSLVKSWRYHIFHTTCEIERLSKHASTTFQSNLKLNDYLFSIYWVKTLIFNVKHSTKVES